jgi:hydrogenase maturation protease
MKRVTVIGVGSPAGDDQIGWQVIDAIATHSATACIPSTLLSLVKLDRPGAALLHYLSKASGLMILIDALQCSASAGSFRRLEITELAQVECPSSHGFGVSHTLALAQALGIGVERLRIYGVVVARTDPEAEMSSEVRSAAHLLAEKVIEDIIEFLSSHRESGLRTATIAELEHPNASTVGLNTPLR